MIFSSSMISNEMYQIVVGSNPPQVSEIYEDGIIFMNTFYIFCVLFI